MGHSILSVSRTLTSAAVRVCVCVCVCMRECVLSQITEERNQHLQSCSKYQPHNFTILTHSYLHSHSLLYCGAVLKKTYIIKFVPNYAKLMMPSSHKNEK